MGQVIIYGASDDLIEVEGDYYEEWSYEDYQKPAVIVIGEDGSVVQVRLRLSDVWSANVRLVRAGSKATEVSYTVVPRPGHSADDDQAAEVVVPGKPLVYKVVER